MCACARLILEAIGSEKFHSGGLRNVSTPSIHKVHYIITRPIRCVLSNIAPVVRCVLSPRVLRYIVLHEIMGKATP